MNAKQLSKRSIQQVVTIDGSATAHRVWSPPILPTSYVYAHARGCGLEGLLRPAPDDAPLCSRCFPGNRRTAGEWRKAVNTPRQGDMC